MKGDPSVWVLRTVDVTDDLGGMVLAVHVQLGVLLEAAELDNQVAEGKDSFLTWRRGEDNAWLGTARERRRYVIEHPFGTQS